MPKNLPKKSTAGLSGHDDLSESLESMASAAEPASASLLVTELNKLKASLSAELTSALSPIHASLEAIRLTVDNQGRALSTIETCLSDHSDRITALESALEQVVSENTQLKAKVDDLENRSRRQNIRIVGVPESVGPITAKSVSELLMEVMGTGVLEKAPELEGAHRPLHPQPAPGGRPRVIIARFHRLQDKERVMQWAREKGQVFYHGQKIFLFNDLSPTLAKQRAAFNPVKSSLHKKGVRFNMRHPATLRVIFEGNTFSFDSPAKAEEFYRQRIEPV